jgi:hypothetical protein
MPTRKKPEPDYAFMDIEREFLAGNHVTLANDAARDALVQFYNVTIGHYLTKFQPQYSYDLWRHDEQFRRMILEEVHVMAAELAEHFGSSPNREQIYEAGKAVLRRLRARNSFESPWKKFELVCMIDRSHKAIAIGD